MQGFFSGSYNVVVGKVKKDKAELGEVNGKWTQVMDFKDAKVINLSSATSEIPSHLIRPARSECFSMQSKMEKHLHLELWFPNPSRSHMSLEGMSSIVLSSCSSGIDAVQRLWSDLTKAILARDMDAATAAKGAVEDAQRDRRKNDDPSKPHTPRFFTHKDGHWQPNFVYVLMFLHICKLLIMYSLPEDPKAAKEVVQQWIWAAPPALSGSS